MKRRQILILVFAVVIICMILVLVSNNSGDFIQYKTVDGIDTITICDINNSNACITMMDKNLGATTDDITNRNSFGNHYQRGNNHGFSIGCWTLGCSDMVTSNAKLNKAVRDSMYNNHGYDGGITNFINGSSDYWDNNRHYDGLRGGAEDVQYNNYGYDTKNNVATNVIGRQGPCPDGYHVPSIGEWSKLLEYRVANYKLKGNNLILSDNKGLKFFNTENGNNSKIVAEAAGLFQKDFKIPFAGFRYGGDAAILAVDYDAYLVSSSPNGKDAYYFVLDFEGVNTSYYDERISGLSLRCFKNFALSF